MVAGVLVSTPALRAGASSANRSPVVRPLRFLTVAEAQTLGAVGEAMVPGSRAAGLVAYVDAQLAGRDERSLLMGKYVGVTAPAGPFYQRVLTAFAAAAAQAYDRPWAALTPAEAADLLTRIAAGEVSPWDAPPAPYCCFVLRADAVDVTYGTPAGFERLGLAYRAHIDPVAEWME
jgi:hypothetical protein